MERLYKFQETKLKEVGLFIKYYLLNYGLADTFFVYMFGVIFNYCFFLMIHGEGEYLYHDKYVMVLLDPKT